jgi:hypothetical protein
MITLKGLDLQSRLTGTNLVDFGGIIGEKLHATDKFEIQGRLIGSAEALTLQKVQSSAARGSMRRYPGTDRYHDNTFCYCGHRLSVHCFS